MNRVQIQFCSAGIAFAPKAIEDVLLMFYNFFNVAGKPAYTLIGTYQDPSFGSQKIMEVGTIKYTACNILQMRLDTLIIYQLYKR